MEIKDKPAPRSKGAYIIVSPRTYARIHKSDMRISIDGKIRKLKLVSDIYGEDTVGHAFVDGKYMGAYVVENLH